MPLDLETLRTEIKASLDELGIAVFHGVRSEMEAGNHVYWNTETHPDFRGFLGAALAAGVKLIVFNHQSLSQDQIDEALDQLEDSDLSREEKRNYESRLKQLQAYEGFTCSLQLSFAMHGEVYSFELHTDWYDALNDIVSELDAAAEEQEDGDSSLGGYFSQN